MPRTNTRRSSDGWPSIHVTMCTTRQPLLHGSIKSKSGSISSPKRPFAAGHSRVSKNSLQKSTITSSNTTSVLIRFPGPQLLILSSLRLRDFVNIFPRQDTTDNLEKFKSILSGMFDRTGIPSTHMQANAVYIAFVTDMLIVDSKTSLANFPAIADYPE